MTTHFVLQAHVETDPPEPARVALAQIENLARELRARTGARPRVACVAADVFAAFGDLPYVIASVFIELHPELPLGTIMVRGDDV